jgi:hypothetical protein
MTHPYYTLLLSGLFTVLLVSTPLSVKSQELTDNELSQAHIHASTDLDTNHHKASVLFYDENQIAFKVPKIDTGLNQNTSANQLSQLSLMSDNLKNNDSYLQGDASGIALSQIGQSTQMTIYQNGKPVLIQSR